MLYYICVDEIEFRIEILKYYRYDNIDVFLADIIDIFRKYR